MSDSTCFSPAMPRSAAGTAAADMTAAAPAHVATAAVGQVSVRDLDVSTPAVVLKFDQNVMHHGGLGVIRSLGRIGVPVYGVHEGRWAPAAGSRYLKDRLFWKPQPHDPGQVLAGLARLAERIGRPAVLLSTDDAGAIFLAEHGSALRPLFHFPDPQPTLPRMLAGKHSLFRLCRDWRLGCPESMVPTSLAHARGFSGDAGYPLVAKLTTPWLAGRELRSTLIVAGDAELARTWLASERAGAELMLQEFIPGGRGDDWFFHGYTGEASGTRPAFTGIKERSYPAGAGLTSLGRSVPNARLRREVTGFLAGLRYRGICDLDLRWDARDGQYKLLDFNPRLGAQFRLFRDSAGFDVVTACYADLTGQPIPAAAQVSGRGFLVENYDPIAAASYWRRGELGLAGWLASLATVDETAWFARDDLRPFGLMCLRMAGRLPAQLLGRQRDRQVRAGWRRRARARAQLRGGRVRRV